MTLAASVPSPFALESPRLRLNIFVVLLAAAALSPNISMPGGLPALRLEQALLAVLIPSFVYFHWRNPSYRRVTVLDGIFVLLGLAITASIIVAPTIVPSVGRSLRDPFEVARVGEYWMLYRVGMTLIPTERTSRTIIYTLLGIGIITTVFSIAQYLDGQGPFNALVTDLWTVPHNLDGVERSGRVVGTIGNANYYSAFSGLLVITSLAVVLLKKDLPGRWSYAFIIAGALASVFSAVLSQSRTGAAGILFGSFIGLVLVLLYRRPVAPVKAIGLLVLGVVMAVTFIQVQPPLVDSFNSRFNPATVGDDASFIVRIQRFRTFFSGFFADAPAFCEGETLEKRAISEAHRPRTGATSSTAGADVLARDAERKQDVTNIANAVLAYFCDEDEWPVGDDLESLLVPDHLAEMPFDPETGEPYLEYIQSSGFWIGAMLEDPADASGPIFAFGTIPNIVQNPSFEGDTYGSTWGARNGATIEAAPGEGLFGKNAARLSIPPGGDVRQFVVFDFPLKTEHVASAWIRSTSGEEERVNLYLIGQTADGTTFDGFAKQVFTASASGEWVPIALPFTTDATSRFTTLQYMLRSEGPESSAVDIMIDGATVTQGPFSPSFVNVSDADPASLRPVDLPQFSDSPLVGIGPRSDAEAGSFDNEYILILDRYGLLGAGPYLAMYFGAMAVAFSAWRKRHAFMDVMGLVGFAFTLTLLVFNVGAGSYHHFALMAVYWPLIGYMATSKRVVPDGAFERHPATASTAQNATAGPSTAPPNPPVVNHG